MSAVLSSAALQFGLRDQVSAILAACFVLIVFLVGKIHLESPLKMDDNTIVIESLPVPATPVTKTTPPVPQQQAPLRRNEKIIQEAVSEVATHDPVPVNPNVSQEVMKPEQVKKTAPTADISEKKRSDADPQFESQIRQLIESSKRYPTGREASLQKPQGVVMACVVLKRDGHLQEVQIQQSSTYALLDNAAKRQLSSIQYPSMPENSFAGSTQHTFCVKLDYKFPS